MNRNLGIIVDPMKKIVLTLSLLCLTSLGYSQEYRASGLAFLQVNPDSRLSALGGSGVGLGEQSGQMGPGIYLMNPAIYAEDPGTIVQAGHSIWYAEAGIEFLGIAFPAYGWNWSTSITSVNLTGFELRDNRALDEPLGEFGAHYLRAGVHGSRALTPKISAGARIDYLYEKIYYDMASGGSVSLGVQYEYSDQLRFGATLNHLGGMGKLHNESTPLPTSLQVGMGISRDIPEINIDYNMFVDAAAYLDDFLAFSGGYEFVYQRFFAVRGGLQYVNDAVIPSFGAGIRWHNLIFDYGLVLPRHQLGTPHQFSVHLLL